MPKGLSGECRPTGALVCSARVMMVLTGEIKERRTRPDASPAARSCRPPGSRREQDARGAMCQRATGDGYLTLWG